MDQQPTANEPRPAAPPVDATTPVGDRSFLAAFALAAFAGWTGLRSIYIKRPTLGAIRLGLLVIMFVAIIVNLTAPYRSSLGDNMLTIAAIIALILAVWALVDLVIAFVRRTDAEKKPLQETPGERRMAMFMGIASIAAPIVLFGSLLITFFATHERPSDRPAASAEHIALSISADEAYVAYESITAGSTRSDIENSLQVSALCESDDCNYIVPTEGTEALSTDFLAKVEVRYSGNTVRSVSFIDTFTTEEDAS